jgi:hypothetical protein
MTGHFKNGKWVEGRTPTQEPRLNITLDRTGLGKILLNDHDISGFTSGLSLVNRAGQGTEVCIEIPSPSVDLTAVTRVGELIRLKIGEKYYWLLECEGST